MRCIEAIRNGGNGKQQRAEKGIYTGMFDSITKYKWLLFAACALMVGIGLFFSYSTTTDIHLTQEEQQWLEFHRIFSISPSTTFAPYEFIDSTGTYAGLSADILASVSKQLGMSFTVVRIDSRDSRMKAIREKQVDMLGAVRESPEWLHNVLLTTPIAMSQDVIVTRRTFAHTLTIDSLIRMRVSIVQGNTIHEELRKKYPEMKFIFEMSGYECLYSISLGRADAAIVGFSSASYYIENKGLPNLRVSGFYREKSPISIAVRNDWPLFTSILNKAIQAMPAIERDRLNKKWLGFQTEARWWNELPLQWIAGGMALFALLAIVILVWNNVLQHQVKSKTAALELELLEHRKTELALRESEAQFRSYTEYSPIGIFICDELGRYQQVNPAASTITGYTAEELLTMTILDLLPPESHEFVARQFQHVTETGRTSSEFAFRHKDGHIRIWSMDGTRLSPTRFMGMVSDITERKRTEQIVAQEKERLSVTLRSIGDGVITTDIDGRVVMLNKAAEAMTGWKSDEATGRHSQEVFHIINELTRELCADPVEIVLRTGSIVELANHTCLIAKNGREIVIADSAAPIRDMESRIVGVVLVFRDSTEKVKLNESMLRAQKLESLGVLAGGIAHDFNNMLAGIFGYLELARESVVHHKIDQVPRYLDKAAGVFDRAKGLTQQLLTFSKGGTPVRKTIPIGSLIKHSANFALSGSNVTCQLDIAEDLWPCDCDENQIGQVIDNIVINGKQAMPAGGKIIITALNVTDDISHPGKFVRISIQDEGDGISEDILPKIFDPFFSTKKTGHGLGLATVFSIVQRHDGWIDVNSKPGSGTTFHLYIPASGEKNISEAWRDASTHKGCGTVLVMDDEEFLREIAGTMLQGLGYTVARAANGKEALALFAEVERSGCPFIASLLDLTIPGESGGKETAVAMRTINPNAVIIASSGYSEDPVISNPKDHGFTDKIIKPYRKKELTELMMRISQGEE